MRITPRNGIKALVLVGIGVAIGVAMPGAQTSNAQEVKKVELPRIGFVNVAKVLRDYKWANAESGRISELRAEYVRSVGMNRSDTESNRRDAESKLSELGNKEIVAVYEHIRDVIAAIAKERGFDLVLGFPAALRPEDEKSPQAAQLMLQSPALMPFYLKPELDFTEEVIERLNKKYPPENYKPTK
jgi:Skp family chaperone for outer membrane proteins